MADSTPHRDEVLAATEPRALFGDAALSDAVGLRRAYAALAKAFRDDAEVTRHVRVLYEQARAVVDRGAPADQPADDGAQAEPAHPLQRLVEAHRRRDAGAMLAVLRDHADTVVAEGGDLLAPTLQVLVFGIGETLPPHELDLLAAVTSRPDHQLEPTLAGHLERAVLMLQELAPAEADPSVPGVITSAIRASWFQPPHVVARVWRRLRDEVETSGLDLRAALDDLEVRHPAVLGAFQRTELRMIRASEPLERTPLEVETLAQHYAPSAALAPETRAPWLRTWHGTAATYVGSYLVLQLFLPFGVSVLGATALRWLLLTAFPGEVYADEDLRARVHDRPIEPLHRLARHHGMWPHELALALTPESPVPFVEEEFAYWPDHPLVRLAQDRSAVLSCMTDAHVARVPEPTDYD